MLCFRKLLVANKIMDKRRDLSRFSVESFLCNNVQNFSQGNLFVLCSRKIPKTPAAKKNMDKRGGEGYHGFPSKVFCTTTPKTLAGEPLCCVPESIR